MKRLFAAIKIIPDKQFLSVYYKLVKQLTNERIKWVEPDNFHLTLKFFGELPGDKTGIICREMDKIVSGFPPFTINIQDTGIFGSSYNPKLIWFGIEDHGPLIALAEKVLDRMDEAGFARDRQNFVPHLTVGRIRRLNNKERFQHTISTFKQVNIMKVKVLDIFLYESHLTPQGPVYEIVRRFGLK